MFTIDPSCADRTLYSLDSSKAHLKPRGGEERGGEGRREEGRGGKRQSSTPAPPAQLATSTPVAKACNLVAEFISPPKCTLFVYSG